MATQNDVNEQQLPQTSLSPYSLQINLNQEKKYKWGQPTLKQKVN